MKFPKTKKITRRKGDFLIILFKVLLISFKKMLFVTLLRRIFLVLNAQN
jgi:hypothetical protein